MYVSSYAYMSQQFYISCDGSKCFCGAVFCVLHVCMLSDIDTDLFHVDLSIDKYWICEMCVCMCVCMYGHMYVCIYSCMGICVCVCVKNLFY